MCLLVIQHQDAPKLGKEWLADFYSHNKDGVGVMYVDGGKLIVKKILPKTAKDFESFYNKEITGKFCAFHLRMKTHGDINLDNCHPYEVLNQQEHGIDLWLMHNGILSTGNASDETKSDTWHYIKNYLVPMLAKNPDFAFTEPFAEIVAEHIGSGNKFVLMDNTGRYQVINQNVGVQWGGLWLSNTYAWSSPYQVSKNSKKANWGQEVTVLPIAKSRYGLSSWGNQSLIEEEMLELEDEEIYLHIESELADLSYFGFKQASDIDFALAYEFIYRMGMDAFFEILECLREGNMLEREFIAVMENPVKATRYIKVLVGEDY
jgi:hypothetical protein